MKLDTEEKRIMAAIERNEFIPVTGRELHEMTDAIAARKKDKTLNLPRSGDKS